jgi:hypothetical protein
VDKDQVAQLIAQSCQPGIVREDQQEQIGLLNLDVPLLIKQLHGFENSVRQTGLLGRSVMPNNALLVSFRRT